MARITIEDCLEHVEDRFKLVLLTAARARQLQAGADPLLADNTETNNVLIAMREIADGRIDQSILHQKESAHWKEEEMLASIKAQVAQMGLDAQTQVSNELLNATNSEAS